MDEDVKEMFKVLIASQSRTDKSVGDLATLLGQSHGLLEAKHLDLADAQMKTEAAIANLAIAVDRFIASGEARFKRIETTSTA
jgi:hypothetical protein